MFFHSIFSLSLHLDAVNIPSQARHKDKLRGDRDAARKAYEAATAKERPARRRELIVANLALQLLKRHLRDKARTLDDSSRIAGLI